MGIEKDYLMRQLLMLFEVIQKILRYRKKGEKGKAFEEIKYFYECLNIDKKVDSMDIAELVELLESKKKLTNEHIEMVAWVLKEQGELAEQESKKTDYYRKAFFLFEKVERESVTFSMDRQMKLAELRMYLN